MCERGSARRFQQFGDLVALACATGFDGINEEAHALERRRYEELVSASRRPRRYVGSRRGDGDIAFNEAMDHAVLLGSMRFATLNLFAAALYHMTEQHLIDLVLRIHNNDERTTADR